MPSTAGTVFEVGAAFRLGDRLVEPRLNRLTRDGEAIQIEIKAMDVLLCLVRRAGEVVTRQEIVDAVWTTEFISDNTLTHAIAELRNALGDDARTPSFIETIHRRGYRLIAAVEPAGPEDRGAGTVARFPVSETLADDARNPYPGLAAFTEADAEFFFGREAEVAALWRKLTTRRLLAVIGPSGVGKSSLLRAGLIPAAPDGWGVRICQPGEAPFSALARALAPDFSDDPEAMAALFELATSDTGFAVISCWRQRHDQALVIVDQFEELFTQNPLEVQARFAELVGRLAREADIHVLLAMRDDFHYRCQAFEALKPVFDALTPIAQPSPEALARALAQPAIRCGYSFDDDGLVDEMIREVSEERAALPLLAFTAARLWEERDRDNRLLTRQAYEDMGGIHGALAGHAEATVAAIGAGRLPVVREIFRNLVTAEGTRATREVDDLLSVFDGGTENLSSRASEASRGIPRRQERNEEATVSGPGGDPSTRPSDGLAQDDRGRAAAEVLAALIDARLLTSYEVTTEDGEVRRTVEIVHESLLAAWPRLVRWQTQDADGARLRDELRQAARTWQEHDRTDDRLWTGPAYREFAVWRERYPGGLSELEEAFAAAMTSLATRRRKRRRIAAAAALAFAVVVAAVFGALWRRSEQETRRAEAAKLLALAQVQLATDPTEALALTTASLEIADNREARELVMQALWTAPPAFELDMGAEQLPAPSFSPDGGHVAVAGLSPEVRVWSDDGQGPTMLGGHTTRPPNTSIWAAEDLVVTGKQTDIYGPKFSDQVQVWSIPDGRLLRTVDFGSPGYWKAGPRRLFAQIELGEGTDRRLELRSWRLPDGPEELLDSLSAAELAGMSDLVAAPDGSGWVVARGRELYCRPFGGEGSESVLELLEADASLASFGESGVLALDETGSARLWSFAEGEPRRTWATRRPPNATSALPDPTGRRVARLGPNGRPLLLWELTGLPGARPLELRRSGSWYIPEFVFHPAGDWCVATLRAHRRLTFWPLARPYPSIIEDYEFPLARKALAFSPDGQWLATGWKEGVRLLPLAGGDPSATVEIRLPERRNVADIRFDPDGGSLLVVTSNDAWVVPLDGGPCRQVVPVQARQIESGAVSPSGNRVATATFLGDGPCTVHVVDVATGARTTYDLPHPENQAGLPGGVISLDFLDEETLLTMSSAGLRRWDLATGIHELVVEMDGTTSMRPTRVSRAAGTAITWAYGSDLGAGFTLTDLASGARRPLLGFGDDVESADLDPSGTVVAAGNVDGSIRVGRLDGGEPHLLVGHAGNVYNVAVSPDLRWVASAGEDGTLRLWPMPDLSKPPLHTLPHDELLTKLKSLTNLRAVRAPDSDTGWTIEIGPFPGWRDVPTW